MRYHQLSFDLLNVDSAAPLCCCSAAHHSSSSSLLLVCLCLLESNGSRQLSETGANLQRHPADNKQCHPVIISCSVVTRNTNKSHRCSRYLRIQKKILDFKSKDCWESPSSVRNKCVCVWGGEGYIIRNKYTLIPFLTYPHGVLKGKLHFLNHNLI